MFFRVSIVLSFIALIVLAALQYRWVDQIAAAERQRLERSVVESSEKFAEDFFTELRALSAMIESPPLSSADPTVIAGRYREWAFSAANPNIVKALYLSRPSAEVLRLDFSKDSFDPGALPFELSAVGAFGTRQNMDPAAIKGDLMVIPIGRRSQPPWEGGRGGRGPRGRGGNLPGRPPRGWEDFGPRPGEPEGESWIVVELNREAIVKEFLPALMARRFQDYDGQNYRVAIVARRGGLNRETVFVSGNDWTEKDFETPDYERNLLSPPPGRRGGPGGPLNPGGPRGPEAQWWQGGPPPGQNGGQRGGPRGGDRGFRGPDPRGPMTMLFGQEWRLLVKHRAGSLETAAMQFRRRNLAISFGVLLILGAGAAAIVVSGSRARKLGKQQMEFAAGVSHELRTPLAVIQSAAHNLRTGVVQDPKDIEEYAGIVQTEARRLTDMVEQVMAYSETQSGRRRYDLAPIDAGDAVDMAIHNLSSVLRENNATVQKRLGLDLPPVMADATAFTRCIQNLLSNAVKYGRSNDSVKIEIEGKVVPAAGTSGIVQLSVIDHGHGVPSPDASHLFEAFYRGANAGANTPGNGLGLHLVRRVMDAHYGSVTYSRASDGGAVFTLTLPVASNPA